MANLFAGRLIARVLFDLVIVLMVQRCLAVPKALLAQLVGVTPLTTITKAGKVFLVTDRTDGGMHNCFYRGQAMQKRQPDQARRSWLRHKCCHEIVDRDLVL